MVSFFICLSISLGAREVEEALDKMIDRCQSGAQGLKASAEELASILTLTDKETAVHICGLYSKVQPYYFVYFTGCRRFRFYGFDAVVMFDVTS